MSAPAEQRGGFGRGAARGGAGARGGALQTIDRMVIMKEWAGDVAGRVGGWIWTHWIQREGWTRSLRKISRDGNEKRDGQRDRREEKDEYTGKTGDHDNR